MINLEVRHLKQLCDVHEIDYAEIDSTLSYWENKEHLEKFIPPPDMLDPKELEKWKHAVREEKERNKREGELPIPKKAVVDVEIEKPRKPAFKPLWLNEPKPVTYADLRKRHAELVNALSKGIAIYEKNIIKAAQQENMTQFLQYCRDLNTVKALLWKVLQETK